MFWILYLKDQGLVTVPFWEYWTSPYSSHYRPYTQWLGDVQWGHLMTHEDSHLNCVSQRRSWCLNHWRFNDSPRFGDLVKPGRSPWSRYGSTLLQLGALASNGSCLAMWRCGLATSRRFEVGPKLMTLEWNIATSRIPTDDVTVDFPSNLKKPWHSWFDDFSS